jgi:hypothetical protein
MNLLDYAGPDTGFWCNTCRCTGGLTIASVTYLELTCPTCHGESRGCSAEEYFKQLEADAAFDRKYNAYWLERLRKKGGKR